MKTMTLNAFLTKDQIKKCAILYQKYPTGYFAKQVHDQIIEPNMKTINEKLGQENDPMYLAYAVEFCMIQLNNR